MIATAYDSDPHLVSCRDRRPDAHRRLLIALVAILALVNVLATVALAASWASLPLDVVDAVAGNPVDFPADDLH